MSTIPLTDLSESSRKHVSHICETRLIWEISGIKRKLFLIKLLKVEAAT